MSTPNGYLRSLAVVAFFVLVPSAAARAQLCEDICSDVPCGTSCEVCRGFCQDGSCQYTRWTTCAESGYGTAEIETVSTSYMNWNDWTDNPDMCALGTCGYEQRG